MYDNYPYVSKASSLFIDFTLHDIEALANMGVLTVIAAGGYIVGIFIMGAELNFSQGVADLSNQTTGIVNDASKAVTDGAQKVADATKTYKDDDKDKDDKDNN